MSISHNHSVFYAQILRVTNKMIRLLGLFQQAASLDTTFLFHCWAKVPSVLLDVARKNGVSKLGDELLSSSCARSNATGQRGN
jgi:hypothetical protein